MKGDFTKAKSISDETKQAVFDRQKGKSVFSKRPITKEMCCCHFVGRGVSGVGYEWNIFGATPDEHRLFDESKQIANLTHEQCVSVIRNHLILNYRNWEQEKCKYHKYWSEEDYGITRRITD